MLYKKIKYLICLLLFFLRTYTHRRIFFTDIMFYNSGSYERNEKILEKLQKGLQRSWQVTHERINSFKSLNDFNASQYISARFGETGFSIERNDDEQIRRVVGDERALQVLGTYGGGSYRQAYINMFAKQYENSKHKRHENTLDNAVRERERLNEEVVQDELLKARKENVVNFYRNAQPWSEEFRKKITNGNKKRYGGGGGDDDEDNDDDNGGEGRGDNRKKKLLAKEIKKYRIHMNKDEDIDDEDVDRVLLENPSPKEVFRENAFENSATYIDPATGNYAYGFDNIASSSMKEMLKTPKNIMIKSSVGSLRAGKKKGILKNNTDVREQLYSYLKKTEVNRAKHVNQFGEFTFRPTEKEEEEEGISFGDLLASRDKTDFEWDNLTTIYESGDGGDGGNGPPPPPSSAPIRSNRIEDEEEEESGEVKPFQLYDDNEEKQLDSLPGGGGRLGISSSNDIGGTIETLTALGYDEDQIAEFINDVEVNFNEFSGLPLDEKITNVTKVLSRSDAVDVDPTFSDLSAEENYRVALANKKQRLTGNVNLFSKEFAWSNKLEEITPLVSRINETTTQQQINDNDPGGEKDPYQQVLFDSTDDNNDDDDSGGASGIIDFGSNSLSDSNEIIELQEEYVRNYDIRLDEFLGKNPILLDNSVNINRFLTKIVKEDPSQIRKDVELKKREGQLNRFIRDTSNPNKNSTRDVVSYDNAANSGIKFGGVDLNFYKDQILDVEDLEENLLETIDSDGKLNVKKTIEKSIEKVRENEESSAGGLFLSGGSNSFSSHFNKKNYLNIIGVNDEKEFQDMFNDRLNTESSDTTTTTQLNDQSKLTFLPNEKRPSFFSPPLSILPTNNEQKLIGVRQPLFGGGGDLEQEPTITTMEIDENLLKTSELNAISSTTSADVNVLVEEQTQQNYALKMRQLQNVSDKAQYVIQLLLKDAIKVGRLDQLMLLNENVITLCQILFHVVEILLNKQSSYFTIFGNSLDLINVDSIQNEHLPYMTLIHNGSPSISLFDVSRNLFNFKMETITQDQFRTNNSTDSLFVFKEFLYFIMKENQMNNIDEMIMFRDENRFRQSTIISYQNLDPQIRTRNFFLMLDNYLLQLHVSGNTDHTNTFNFNNIMESDLNRRFTTVILNFMANINATMERMLTKTPLSLIFTENSSRATNMRALSYRRTLEQIITNYANNSSFQSNIVNDRDEWRMLFHNRNDAQYQGMSSVNLDTAPSGRSLQQMISQYRNQNFTNSYNGNNGDVAGGEWKNIEPTALMDVLVYAFVEHGVIPPLSREYSKSLSNFFAILMADPVQQVFLSHIKLLYRRGWGKEDLARKTCYVLVEQYVGLILLVVQRALLQDDTSLSSTAAFMGNIGSISPMIKIQEVLKSLIVAFNPISFLQEEINNREEHERKFYHHFQEYARSVNEIIQSHEMWLQEKVEAFSILEMSRSELFQRIISSGGYEETRSNILNEVVINVSESDHQTSTIAKEEDMEKIDITIVNSGTQTMSVPESIVKQPITLVDDPQQIEPTRVIVDASHPEVNNLSTEEMLSLVKDTIKNEVNLLIQKVVVPENTKTSTSTRSYVAYATEGGGGGDLLESEISKKSTIKYNVDVSADDSASQANFNNDLSTVDYGAGETILQASFGEEEDEDLKVPPPQTLITIGEPQVITADSEETKIVNPNSLTIENNVTIESEGSDLISSELNERIEAAAAFEGVEEEEFNSILVDGNASEFARPNEVLSTSEKNVYSISEDLIKNNMSIKNRIAKLSNKANIEVNKLSKSIKTNRGRVSILSKSYVKSLKRDIEKSSIEAVTDEYKSREKKIHERNAEKSVPSFIEEKKAMVKRVKAKLPRDLSFSTKHVIVNSGKIGTEKRKRKAQKLNNATQLKLRRLEKLQKERKKLQEEFQLTGIKRKHQQKVVVVVDQDDTGTSIESRLERLNRFQQQVPERLVTKPFVDDEGSFNSNLSPSFYSSTSSKSSSLKKKKGI